MNNWIKVILFTLLIFSIHNIWVMYSWDNNFVFSSGKGGPYLYNDRSIYASLIKNAAENPSLFVTDPNIQENSESFANGNLLFSILGAIYCITNDMNSVFLIGAFMSILLSVWLILKILEYLNLNNLSWQFLAITLLLLTSFEDPLGISNLVQNMSDSPHNPIFNMGYIGRFPFMQCSIPLLLFWILQLLKIRNEVSIMNSLLLAISLLVLQYSYFFYWSAALPITILSLIFFSKRSSSNRNLIIGGFIFLIGSLPFFLKLISSLNSEITKDYLSIVKGPSAHFPHYIVYITFIITFFLDLKSKTNIHFNQLFFSGSKKFLNIFYILLVILFAVGYEVVNYAFHPSHSLYEVFSISYFIFLLLTSLWILVLVRRSSNWQKAIRASQFNILLTLVILLLINASTIIEIPQPYHWLYVVYYPFMILNILHSIPKFYQKNWMGWGISGAIILIVIFNNYQLGKFMAPYHHYNNDQQEALNFIDKNVPMNSICLSNNFELISSFSSNLPIKNYFGNAFTNVNSMIDNFNRMHSGFQAMGFTNYEIISEYSKFREFDKYIGSLERKELDSLFPDNIMLARGIISHSIAPIRFEGMLVNYAIENKKIHPSNFDYIIWYKPHTKKEPIFDGKLIFENEEISIFSSETL